MILGVFSLLHGVDDLGKSPRVAKNNQSKWWKNVKDWRKPKKTFHAMNIKNLGLHKKWTFEERHKHKFVNVKNIIL